MAEVKRKFYNKEFGKRDFYEGIIELAEDGATSKPIDKILAAAQYELEGLDTRPSKAGGGERKDPLQSDYANEVRASIIPFINSTPKSAEELVNEATARGIVSSKGTPFAKPWVSRVLNKEEGISASIKVVEITNKKGLKEQKEVVCYSRG